MDKMREQFVAEIARLEVAIVKTKSEKLRTDYRKAVRRLRKELVQYDRSRTGKPGPGI